MIFAIFVIIEGMVICVLVHRVMVVELCADVMVRRNSVASTLLPQLCCLASSSLIIQYCYYWKISRLLTVVVAALKAVSHLVPTKRRYTLFNLLIRITIALEGEL